MVHVFSTPLFMIIAAIACVVLSAILASKRRAKMGLMGAHNHTAPLLHETIVAAGSMLVTDSGSAMIDEPLPYFGDMLSDPEKYVIVEFDPNQPVPPPCAVTTTNDDVNWELSFRHTHAVPMDPDKLHLTITWNVSAARTIVWRVYERPVVTGVAYVK